jgi:competence protein ComGC
LPGALRPVLVGVLLVFIAVVVLVVCLVIFVGIPHIAQQKIDAATLTIEGIRVTNTQTQNFTMSINSTIHSDGSVKATIDGFTGDMYLEDLQPHTPFASVTFPETTSDAIQIVNVTQFTPITNMDAFTTFNTWLLHNKTLRVTVKGDTYIHVSGIAKAFPVSFSKTVEMPGLNNFDGTSASEARISQQADANGDNFHGFASIPNPSLVTFEIGNVTFDTFLLGQYVGPTYLDNVLLVAGGANNFTMHANVSQLPVIGALGQQPYCSNGGVLPFQLRGKDVFNNGQPLPYYANALSTGNQTVPLPIGAAIKAALNITVPCA